MKNDKLYWPITAVALGLVAWLVSPELAHLTSWEAVRAIRGTPVDAATTMHGVYAAGVAVVWFVVVHLRSRNVDEIAA